mmetsp:Transcript_4400/g.11086  ORF Transcript_4400/g.11086 Transcript_4400/m.11086 type:complete len:86 (-) Transcript_4400:165-422(-)
MGKCGIACLVLNLFCDAWVSSGCSSLTFGFPQLQCEGTVVEDPIQIADELILTIHFGDDDSTHKVPFSPDEKARWRPAQSDPGWQ